MYNPYGWNIKGTKTADIKGIKKTARTRNDTARQMKVIQDIADSDMKISYNKVEIDTRQNKIREKVNEINKLYDEIDELEEKIDVIRVKRNNLYEKYSKLSEYDKASNSFLFRGIQKHLYIGYDQYNIVE